MNISEATLDDIPALAGLLTILFTEETEFSPESSLQEKGLRQIIGRPDTGKILVLRDGERVCGMVNLLFTVSTARGGRVAVLEDMIVAPANRGCGWGSRLLAAALHSARSAGCSRITLLTDATNTRALRLYQRQGFQTSTMVPLRLHLEPCDP